MACILVQLNFQCCDMALLHDLLLVCRSHIMCDTQGRGKKDAKQVSAAAVLEMLLVNVPESDFLMPGKAKQTKTVQVGQMIFCKM